MRVFLALAVSVPLTAGTASDFFESRVRPLLAKNCYACHTSSRMGSLRLDSRADILKGGNSGPALVPGKPDDSLLIRAVRRTHERIKMPPQQPLSAAEVADLEAWIAAGAVWPDTAVPAPVETASVYRIAPEQRAFWSFQPVRKPAPPAVRNTAWIKSPIDRFILAKLEAAGLEPVTAADRHALIRRVTYDLTGLPPSPEEVDAFEKDKSPEAFARLVDRLLASPRYGERWGRHWLDLARYADGQHGVTFDTPYSNAWRYRDWVIQSFNEDLPYNAFVKAQIAGDLLPDNTRLVAGLGFQAIGDDNNDRLDVSSRVFLGLTVGCAQCHNHKFDPIPTKDYYSLLGVFASSKTHEYPLAPSAEVEIYKRKKKELEEKQAELTDWTNKQIDGLADIFAAQTARYLMTAWRVSTGAEPDVCAAARAAHLDADTLERWIDYLADQEREYVFMQPWFDAMARRAPEAELEKIARDVQTLVLAVFTEKKEIDDRNYVKLGGAKGVKDERTRQYANLEFLQRNKFYFWRDLASEPYRRNQFDSGPGVYYHGPKRIERYLSGQWRQYLAGKRAEIDALKAALPQPYPFLHSLTESDKPANGRIAIRGDTNNLGEEAPRRFLQILSNGDPAPFTHGSGRLDLAEAVASPSNPLTARVMVNRVWQIHFGEGIVRTPSNFGQLGERPTHPELLDWLAARFVENGWSVKKLHREILLTSVYQLSTTISAASKEKDPENRLLWRASLRPRLDVEALRDFMLAVAGNLDLTPGGPPAKFDESNRRRTVWGVVARTRLEPMLALFDFPNPNNHSEQRAVTIGPMQRLYFMNNPFVEQQARLLADRLKPLGSDADRVRQAYRLLYSRPATAEEIRLGVEFVKAGQKAWPQYAQVLLGSSEFLSVQ